MTKLIKATIVVAMIAMFAVVDFHTDGPLNPHLRTLHAQAGCNEGAINTAIQGLPATGGTVQLMPGTYVICRTAANPIGGIIIDRSNVVLDLTTATLELADFQDTNVIRVLGNVSHVTIRGGHCDGNWTHNDHDLTRLFEAGCVRAGSGLEQQSNIVVENFHAFRCPRLCVMVWANDSVVRNSTFGTARSDVVEMLGSGLSILNNRATIVAETEPSPFAPEQMQPGFVFGGDSQDNLLIANNHVWLRTPLDPDAAVFRTYPGHYKTVLTGNIVQMDPGVNTFQIVDLGSYLNVVSGNSFTGSGDGSARALFRVNGGTTITGNLFENVRLTLVDTAGWGALVQGNLLANTLLPSNVAIGVNHQSY